MMGFGMGLGSIGGLLVMTLFWGGMIFLGVWLVRALFAGNVNNRQNQSGSHPTALELLAQRYARGEITREQYEMMKQDLG